MAGAASGTKRATVPPLGFTGFFSGEDLALGMSSEMFFGPFDVGAFASMPALASWSGRKMNAKHAKPAAMQRINRPCIILCSRELFISSPRYS